MNSLKNLKLDLLKESYAEFTKKETSIWSAKRALINSREFHTLNYDNNFEALDCNTVEYYSDKSSKIFGIIQNFFKINSLIICVVQHLKIEESHNFKNMSDIFKENFNRFFYMVSVSNKFSSSSSSKCCK